MTNENAAEEIKSRLDIVEVVSDYVALKRSGQNFKGLCPFHPEKTPSFMVSSPKQIFHCFGCGAGGDVLGFVMKYENLTFPEALELLAKRAGVELKPRRPAERGIKETIKAVNLEAQNYFARSLSQSRQAQDYLEKRGIEKKTLSDFGLGFAPDSWHSLSDHLKRKGFNETQIKQAGLTAAGQKGPYDIFRGRVMFPILDMHGEVVAFGGRVMGKGEPKYLNSPDSTAFHKRSTLYALYRAKEAIREAGESVVVEGYMDAIMCHQHGIRNVVAPLGTALTAEHVKALGRHASAIALVFDGDQAGISAARRSLELILSEGAGISVRVLLLPEGEDPDSILKKNGAERFGELLSQALGPVDFMLQSSKEGKTETLREAIRIISVTEDPILRDQLLGDLSDRTGTREQTLREELARQSRKAPTARGAAQAAKAATRTFVEEVLLLGVAVAVPGKAAQILERVPTEDFRDPLVRGVFEKVKNSGAEDPARAEGLSEAERALVSRLQIEPGIDVAEADRNVEDCIKAMEKRRSGQKKRLHIGRNFDR